MWGANAIVGVSEVSNGSSKAFSWHITATYHILANQLSKISVPWVTICVHTPAQKHISVRRPNFITAAHADFVYDNLALWTRNVMLQENWLHKMIVGIMRAIRIKNAKQIRSCLCLFPLSLLIVACFFWPVLPRFLTCNINVLYSCGVNSSFRMNNGEPQQCTAHDTHLRTRDSPNTKSLWKRNNPQ